LLPLACTPPPAVFVQSLAELDLVLPKRSMQARIRTSESFNLSLERSSNKDGTMTHGKGMPKARKTTSRTGRAGSGSKSPANPGAKKADSGKGSPRGGQRATGRVNEKHPSPGDWRIKVLAQVRRIIDEADPRIVEEVKWIKPTNPAGVPVWSHAGIICTGETYKQVVKLTFARGASLPDPHGLFNSSLDGNTRRAIDIHEEEVLDTGALKALIQAAVAENLRAREASNSKAPSKTKKGKPPANEARPPRRASIKK
jgi:hypothetical protein